MDMKSKCHFCAYVGLFPYVMNIQSCKMYNQIYYSSIVRFFFCVCQSKEIIIVTTELCLSKSGIKLMQVECTFWNRFWTFSLLLFGFAWLRQNIYQSGSSTFTSPSISVFLDIFIFFLITMYQYITIFSLLLV